MVTWLFSGSAMKTDREEEERPPDAAQPSDSRMTGPA